MKPLFHGYKLTEEQQKKGRRILRVLSSTEYFGDLSNLLIRIVATYHEKLNLIEEAEKMQEWVKDKNGSRKRGKKPSVARFHSWVQRSTRFKEERRRKDEGLSDELKRDFDKVNSFKRSIRK